MYPCVMIARLVSGVITIMCVNIFFLMYTIVLIRNRSNHLERVCSINEYTEIITAYIKDNKLNYFLDKVPAMCPGPGKRSLEAFQGAIGNLLDRCKYQRPIPPTSRANNQILTLFTTWNTTKEASEIYYNTLENWSRFLPKINPVLFTNDSHFREEALSHGWTVLPVTHYGADGVPVLKYMFSTIMASFNSTYYSYCNGDILFTDNLLETLTLLRENITDPKVFFTGRRTNIQNVTKGEISSNDNLKMAAEKRGKLFIISAEDYFITTKSFPWNEIPEFIIGRPSYDNFLVADARCNRKFISVDLTETVLAVHQTTDAGNKEGHHHGSREYNHQLLLNMKIKNPYTIYSRGYATCSEYHSIYNLCGDIEIIKRKISTECKC